MSGGPGEESNISAVRRLQQDNNGEQLGGMHLKSLLNEWLILHMKHSQISIYLIIPNNE